MQDVVGHDDQMCGVQATADRRDQRFMKLAKMSISRRLKLFAERADELGSQTEFRELELQQPHVIPYASDRPQRHDVEPVLPHHTDVGLPARLVVLEENSVAPQARANLLYAE